ncbi:MAG: formate dehydrogenase accessory sulfurtransferase FdhD [Acidimicrobiales bacterium]
MSTPRQVTPVQAIKVRPGRSARLPEMLATEEPMEIRVAGPGQEPVPVAVTMRTPGNDFELATGFLVTEGLASPAEVAGAGYCDSVRDEEARFNTVTVALHRRWERTGPVRAFTASASCGVCGKTSIGEVELSCQAVAPAVPVPASLISAMPARLRETQRVFEQTGGLHAAGLFGADGSLWWVREDIGRHNAVDKIAGRTVIAGKAGEDVPDPVAACVLMVSGRVSFEIVQKVAMMGVGVVAAVSAPSSLAVAAAERLGVAVVGFVRDGSYNIYSGAERLDVGR